MDSKRHRSFFTTFRAQWPHSPTEFLSRANKLSKEPESCIKINPELTLPKLMEIAEEIYNLDDDWAARGYSLFDYGPYNHSKDLVNAYSRILSKNL